MSPVRKDSKMGIGMLREFIKVAFHFACVLTIMSLMTLPLVKIGTAEYYILILTFIINGITFIGIILSRGIVNKVVEGCKPAQEEDNDIKN